MKCIFIFWLAVVLFTITSCSKLKEKDKFAKASAPNIIFLIGDGMGLSQISTAYYFGDEKSNFSRFRNIGFHRSSDLKYKVTDSAAGATAFAIGQKTYRRAIGVSIDSIPQENILEFLQKENYKTGVVTMTSITGATPAAFYAHAVHRDMNEDIATYLVDADIDLVIGGGRQYFNKRKDGKNLILSLIEKGYLVDTLELSKPDFNRQNVYLLADDNMPSRIAERGDMFAKATRTALDYFEQSPKPYFLMIEGAFIDWAGHGNDAEMLVEEVEDFDKTLGILIDFVEKHPNTLLVVTADHETGGASLAKKYHDTEVFGRKKLIPDEIELSFNSKEHTATLIPVFAKGPGAEDFQGIYENNDIYHKLISVYQANKNK